MGGACCWWSDLWVLFMSEGRGESEIDRWIGVTAVHVDSAPVHHGESAEHETKAPDLPVDLRTITYGHELWVVTERLRSQIQAAKMSFLWRVAGCFLRDCISSSAI